MSKVSLVLVGILVLAAVAIGATPVTTNPRAEVETAVRAYIDAQNRGDVYAMMSMVDRRDGVISVSDGQIQRGWQTIRSTNDLIVGREATPGIAVSSLDVMVLSPTVAVAVASFTFTVQSPHGTVHVPGASSLVFEKSERKWLVVNEHTSVATQEVAHGVE